MEHLSSAPIVERSWDKGNMKAVPYILGISQVVVKEMAGSSHTLPCCVSKLRSSLEAGKKQLRVWLQYVCGVTEMLLYPSFGAPLVFLRPPYDDSELARNGFEDGSKWYATGNVCSCANAVGFVGLQTYVQKSMKPCSILWTSNQSLLPIFLFLTYIKA